MRIGLNKHCPRCNYKMPTEIVVCPQCQLNYNKFNSATNKQAKQKLRQGEKESVLMRKGRPDDVKFVPLLLMCVFLGFLGAHHYYVGRYKMGFFYSLFFTIGVAYSIIASVLKISPKGDLWQVFSFLVLGWGIVLFMWILDIAKICLNKYKIPVSRE